MGKLRIVIFCQFLVITTYSQIDDNSSIVHDTLELGRLLFMGYSEKYDSAYSCVECHSLTVVDTFTWNPTAYEIATSFADKEISAYEEALLYAMSERMFEAHERAENLDQTDFIALKSFLLSIKKRGPPTKKQFPSKKFILILLMTLILLITFDALFVNLLKLRFIHRLLVLSLMLIAAIYFYPDVVNVGLQKNYEPDQPIKFSHRTHSIQNGTTCIYCHPYSRYSAVAGIPGLNVCMNCHALVREGSRSGETELKKLIAAWEDSIPIKWIRINNLPEHVQFNHSIHYEVGKIDCTRCHGEVENYDRLVQIEDLSMKWCLNCHKTENVKMKENGYYQYFRMVTNEYYKINPDSSLVKDLGGWDCMHCHY